MTEYPYRPILHTQAELEQAWRHLMEPLGFAACRSAGVETDVVHLATDDTLVPLPMDVALAEPA